MSGDEENKNTSFLRWINKYEKLSKKDEKVENNFENLEDDSSEFIEELDNTKSELKTQSNDFVNDTNEFLNNEINKIRNKKDKIKENLSDLYVTPTKIIKNYTIQQFFLKFNIDGQSEKIIWGTLFYFVLFSLLIIFFYLVGLNTINYLIVSSILSGIVFSILFLSFSLKTYEYNKGISKATKEIGKMDIESKEIDNNKFLSAIDEIRDMISNEKITGKTILLKNLISGYLPFVKNTLYSIKEHFNYKHRVDKFVSAMDYYSVPIPGLKNQLMDLPIPTNEPKRWEKKFIKHSYKNTQEEYKSNISQKGIETIYREYIGDQIELNNIWKSRDENLVSELAFILKESEILPSSPYEYEKEDLEIIINDLDMFKINKIKNNLYDFYSIIQTCERYEELLEKNDVLFGGQFKKKKIYNKYEETKNINNRKERKLSLLSSLFMDKLEKNYDMSPEKIEGIAYFSLPLLYDNNHLYLDKACKFAANNDYAVRATHTYKKLLNNMQNGEKLTIKQVISKMNETDFNESSIKKEVKTQKTLLKDGNWKNSLPELFLETLEKNTTLNQDIEKQKEINENIKNAIKDLFHDVKEDTIHRVIDSELFSAFIITFETKRSGELKGRGKLQPIIDDFKNKYNFFELF